MDDVHVFLRGLNAALALFLKSMQHKNRLFKLDCVHRTIGAMRITFDDLQHARATKALEHLGRFMLFTCLRQTKCKAKLAAHLTRQGKQVLVAAADPFQRLLDR